MVRRSLLFAVALIMLGGGPVWAGKQIIVTCSDAVTETHGNAAENRTTAGTGGTYTCPCLEGDCAVSFMVSWGAASSGRGHVSFTLYDRYGQKAATLSAKAVAGEKYYMHLLITEGPAAEISRDGQNVQFRVDPNQFFEGRVEIALSGVIDAAVESFDSSASCYVATATGAGMYRVEIPFTVTSQGLVC